MSLAYAPQQTSPHIKKVMAQRYAEGILEQCRVIGIHTDTDTGELVYTVTVPSLSRPSLAHTVEVYSGRDYYRPVCDCQGSRYGKRSCHHGPIALKKIARLEFYA